MLRSVHLVRASVTGAWRRLSSLIQVAVVGAICFTISFAAAALTRFPADLDSLQVLVGAAYFLFGVFVAVALDSARTRMSKVNDLLKVDEANFLALHELARPIGPSEQARLRDLIDAHLQDQIDYRLVDFHLSALSHLSLLRFVVDLAGKDHLGHAIEREQMLTVMLQTNANRTQVEASTGHTLSRAEWTSIFSLFLLLCVTLPFFDGGGLFGAFVVGLLTAILAVLVAILWGVDHLQWQEESWIWSPLHRLFTNLGLPAYYPQDVLEERRARPSGPVTVRVARYPSRYPDMTGKTVEEVTWPVQ